MILLDIRNIRFFLLISLDFDSYVIKLKYIKSHISLHSDAPLCVAPYMCLSRKRLMCLDAPCARLLELWVLFPCPFPQNVDQSFDQIQKCS